MLWQSLSQVRYRHVCRYLIPLVVEQSVLVWRRHHHVSCDLILQVDAPTGPTAPAAPKTTYTYAGEKKLDLGFGAAPASYASDVAPLTWQTLRKVNPQLACKHCSTSPLFRSPHMENPSDGKTGTGSLNFCQFNFGPVKPSRTRHFG